MESDIFPDDLDCFFANSVPSLNFDFDNLTIPSDSENGSVPDSIGSPSSYSIGSPHTPHCFTAEDDELLRHLAVEMNFDWPRIARLIQNKTPSQVAKRWTSKLDPNIKKSKWSPIEDRRIEKLQQLHGNNWKLIATYLPGRPPAAIKSRYYNSIKRKGEMKTVHGTSYLTGSNGLRNIRQMPLAIITESQEPQHNINNKKEERITALRKELAGMEVLMNKTKEEISRLQSRMQSQPDNA